MSFYKDFENFFDNNAFIDENGEILKYRELQSICDEIKILIGSRNLITCFCKNSIGSVVGYIACLYSDNVPILIKSDIEQELRENLLEIYKPKYVWIPDSMSLFFEDGVVVYERYGYQLRKITNGSVKLHDDLALLLSTSGSTGSPKLVRQSYKNIQSNAEAIAQYLNIDYTERPITTLPMNYTYGLSIINSHLLVGATILLTNRGLVEREFWEFFREYEATSFGGVPYTYEMLNRLRFFKMDLPSLRYMTEAGGKLEPKLHQQFAEYAMKTDKKFFVMYGQTAATARMSYLPAEMSFEKYGSMGIAIPGGKFSLIDNDGNIIEKADVVGELIYEGPNVTMGYAECKVDLSKADEWNGRLVTGDMAKRDGDGFYYIVGRKKRFLKVYGNRVNLDELERIIKKEYDFIDCACAGVDDNVYIFITNCCYEESIQLRDYIADKTKLNRAAFKVKCVDSIPKSDSGKTLYKNLEVYYD